MLEMGKITQAEYDEAVAQPMVFRTEDYISQKAEVNSYFVDTAITANSTTTSAVKGSIGLTTNATGVGKIFYSDGTKWQYAAVS